jgi:hypothetical protein
VKAGGGDRLTLQILAAVVEDEARRISERIIEARPVDS